MKRKVFFFFIATVNLLYMHGYAQRNDWGFWMDVAAGKKIKSATATLTGEFYTKEKNRQIERISIGLCGLYPITSHLQGEVGYLLMNYNPLRKNEIRNRFFSSLSLRYDFLCFEVSCRERIQLTRKSTPQTANRNSWYWRNRLKLKHKDTFLGGTPSATMEMFHPLKKGAGHFFDEYRYSLDMNYPIVSNQNIVVYAMWIATRPLDFFAVGLQYEISL